MFVKWCIFLWKILSLSLVENIVETLKMDHEETNFSCEEVNSDKQMELFRNPAYHGHLCNGTQSQGIQVPNGESLALFNQAVSLCPHPNGGELDGLGQTCFLKISVPSFFMPYRRTSYLMLSCTESLPAFSAFLHPPLHQKGSGSNIMLIGELHIHQPV